MTKEFSFDDFSTVTCFVDFDVFLETYERSEYNRKILTEWDMEEEDEDSF